VLVDDSANQIYLSDSKFTRKCCILATCSFV